MVSNDFGILHSLIDNKNLKKYAGNFNGFSEFLEKSQSYIPYRKHFTMYLFYRFLNNDGITSYMEYPEFVKLLQGKCFFPAIL